MANDDFGFDRESFAADIAVDEDWQNRVVEQVDNWAIVDRDAVLVDMYRESALCAVDEQRIHFDLEERSWDSQKNDSALVDSYGMDCRTDFVHGRAENTDSLDALFAVACSV